MVKQKPFSKFKAPKMNDNGRWSEPTSLEEFIDQKFNPPEWPSMIIMTEDGESTHALPFRLGKGIGYTIFSDPPLMLLKAGHTLCKQSQVYRDRFPENSEKKMVQVPSNVFSPYIETKVSAVIMMHSALEAFINKMIPVDVDYKSENSRQCDREACIRLGFKEKFRKVILKTKGVDYHSLDQKGFNQILNYTKLRDDLVHMKPEANGTKAYYFSVFAELNALDLNEMFETIMAYMNTFDEGYVELFD